MSFSPRLNESTIRRFRGRFGSTPSVASVAYVKFVSFGGGVVEDLVDSSQSS